MNLDSTATPPTNGSPNFSTSEQVYDSIGNAHVLDLYFTNTGANAWKVSADLDGPSSGITAAVTGGSAAAGPGTGAIDFQANGTVNMAAAAWLPLKITLSDTNVPAKLGTTYQIGAPGNAIALNLTDASGNPTITQYAETSAKSANSADGNAATNLSSVAIADGGKVVATYSDGTKVTVGQLAMATFQNPSSLIAIGNNDYQVSGETSAPSVGLPGTGGRGQILGSSLESSTVDIATEFTNLLVYERGYQADSKVVTTADQINQDTIALIR
jgi:flagellar hook protein FlgE